VTDETAVDDGGGGTDTDAGGDTDTDTGGDSTGDVDEDTVPSRGDSLPQAASLEGGGFGCAVNPTLRGGDRRWPWGLLGSLLVAAALRRSYRSRRRQASALAVAAVGVSALAIPLARAQEAANGFSINRYAPSARGSDWFAGESLD